MQFPRASGILLHPTSLPGEYGIGDLGTKAFEFVDFLVRSKQTYWQLLPIGPTGWGDSPYASYSAFAGNTLLISPEKLIEAGVISEAPKNVGSADRVDYGAVYESKKAMLRSAFDKFQDADAGVRCEFDAFVAENAGWLEDYSLYRALKLSNDHKPWFEWEDGLKLRDEKVLNEAQQRLQDEILAEKFYQFLFFRQWSALREYANSNGVKIVGDVPIFLALDSADVWRYSELFKLNEDGSPKVVSGVPPDYFSRTGQLWGNPIYDWDAMQSDGFAWWVDRVRSGLRSVDILRIDHFRGFAGAWEVPGGAATAENGQWVDAPGRQLFSALQAALGDLPFWVEDLGFITPDVEALRDDFGFPGMRILQFAFGSDAQNGALPHNYVRNCIAYTGTHDNDTTVGWWNSQEPESSARAFCMKYLATDGAEIHWDMIRAAWASVADTAVAPLQDILGLDNQARMNLPASNNGNWQWRFKDGDLTDRHADKLGEISDTYGRSIG